MRLRLSLLALLPTLILSGAACRSSAPASYSADNQIEIYGRHSCPVCQSFSARLEEAGLAYKFHDIDEGEAHKATMWRLVRSAYPELQSVGLPVVVVNGRTFVRPDWDEFTGELKPGARAR